MGAREICQDRSPRDWGSSRCACGPMSEWLARLAGLTPEGRWKVGDWSCARSMSYGAVESESVSRLGVLNTAGRMREMRAAMGSSVAPSQEQVGKSRCQGRGLRGEVGDGGGVRRTW